MKEIMVARNRFSMEMAVILMLFLIHVGSPFVVVPLMTRRRSLHYTQTLPRWMAANAENGLTFERITDEWTAKYTPQTDFIDAGYYLAPTSEKEIVVETLRFEAPRIRDSGLGIQLEEIAATTSGSQKGLGITVVTGLVEGGCFESSDIRPGDVLSTISLERAGGSIALASESTECLDYEATVDRILSLPGVQSDDETWVLTVKRLRPKAKLKVSVVYPNFKDSTSIELYAGENLREAMLRNGIKLTDPLAKEYFADLGSGTCGQEGFCCHCAVSVTQGFELLNAQGSTEEQWLAETPRWRLSCKAIAAKEGELTVRVNVND
mmetsp:Transcript_13700/g.20084  ORF Transcript_13700/g.20084 Transcript_13700/m.20084 type:complete len:322 (-) Transcript_13700:178-1143(-)